MESMGTRKPLSRKGIGNRCRGDVEADDRIALLNRHPGTFDGLYVRGPLAREDGDYTAALKFLQAAAEQQPKHDDVRLNLGMMLAKLHRIRRLRRNLKMLPSCRT